MGWNYLSVSKLQRLHRQCFVATRCEAAGSTRAKSFVTDIQRLFIRCHHCRSLWLFSCHIIKQLINDQDQPGVPHLPLVSAIYPPTQCMQSNLSCCIVVIQSCKKLDMQGIAKSSSNDDTKVWAFSCHIMFLISDYDFWCDRSEGTWIRLLLLPARWMTESANTSKLRCLIMTQ